MLPGGGSTQTAPLSEEIWKGGRLQGEERGRSPSNRRGASTKHIQGKQSISLAEDHASLSDDPYQETPAGSPLPSVGKGSQVAICAPPAKRTLASFPTPYGGEWVPPPPCVPQLLRPLLPLGRQGGCLGTSQVTLSIPRVVLGLNLRSFPLAGPRVLLCELEQGTPLGRPIGRKHPSLWSDTDPHRTPGWPADCRFHSFSVLGAPGVHALHRGPAHHSHSPCSPRQNLDQLPSESQVLNTPPS